MVVKLANVRMVLVAAGLYGASACSGDFGDASAGAATDDGDDDEGAGTSGPAEADSTGEPDPADSEGPSDETSEDGGECPLDCGEGGFCDLDEDDMPYCSCLEGYVGYGLRCFECTPTAGLVEVDIPIVDVTATFLLDGEDFPTSIYEYGVVLLHDPVTGDEIELGSTRLGGTTEPIPIIPGLYELRYSVRAGGELVPLNDSARLDTIVIPESGSYDFVVDIPSVEIAGEIQMGGEAPPMSIYENGTLLLRNRANGDEIELGETRDQEYSALIIPGHYDVHYRRHLAENSAPFNDDARIGVIEVFAGEEQQVLDLDVPVTLLSGSFELDGADPPTSIYENGRVMLRDIRTGDETVLGETRDGSYAVPIVPGQYEIVYQRLLGGDLVPANNRAILGEVVVDAGAQLLDIDIETAVITGVITVDGAPAPADPSNDGLILLRDPNTGDEATLGNTYDGNYSRRVVLGQYDVHYRQETSNGLVPVNTNARITSIDVQGGASFDIDVPVVSFGAEITLNGMLPPESAYDDGMLYLRNEDSGDSVLLGSTRLASLARPVVPGVYDLVYVVESAGPTVPVNAQARLATIDVADSTQIDVDIPVTSMGGPILVEGVDPPAGTYNRAELFLQDVATDDIIQLGSITSGAFGQSLTTGTYVLAYRGLASTGVLPVNGNTGLACYQLTAP